MGVANVPSAAGGGIKSVQRGSAAGSGNVTITAVDITKSFVTVFGSASSGTVSSSFGMSVAAGNVALIGTTEWNSVNAEMYRPNGSNAAGTPNRFGSNNNITTEGSWTATVASNVGAVTVNAGSNNLVAAQVTGFLANATTLTVSGACRYEVVEFA